MPLVVVIATPYRPRRASGTRHAGHLQALPILAVARGRGGGRLPRHADRLRRRLHPLLDRRAGEGDRAAAFRRAGRPRPGRDRCRAARRSAELRAVARRRPLPAPLRAARPCRRALGQAAAARRRRPCTPFRTNCLERTVAARPAVPVRPRSPRPPTGWRSKALAAGMLPRGRRPPTRVSASGCSASIFVNPLGMAAGLDKNGEVPDAVLGLGFGFVEVGTVTPRPQTGNPSPRMFRLVEHEALINRLGFNNEGLDAVHARLARRAAAASSASMSGPTRTAPTASPTMRSASSASPGSPTTSRSTSPRPTRRGSATSTRPTTSPALLTNGGGDPRRRRAAGAAPRQDLARPRRRCARRGGADRPRVRASRA